MGTENSTGNQRGKPFKPGQSGNPSGKPRGTRNRTTILLEKIMFDDAADVTRKVIEAAKGGDMQAARMLLDRVSPVPKGRRLPISLPDLETASDVVRAHAATISAMSSGAISPDEASVIAGVLEAKRRAIETVELEVRIKALESRAA